jgi:hypothetical protein
MSFILLLFLLLLLLLLKRYNLYKILARSTTSFHLTLSCMGFIHEDKFALSPEIAAASFGRQSRNRNCCISVPALL